MLIIVTSCGRTDSISTDAPDDKPADTYHSSPKLEGTSWDLYSFQKSSLIEGTSFTITFTADQATGNAGCNQFFGAYQIEKDRISFSGLGMTEMACMAPEGLMEQELVLLEFLSMVERLELSEGSLVLFRGDGEALSFDPVLD
jgi:heat shock protein HslJ